MQFCVLQCQWQSHPGVFLRCRDRFLTHPKTKIGFAQQLAQQHDARLAVHAHVNVREKRALHTGVREGHAQQPRRRLVQPPARRQPQRHLVVLIERREGVGLQHIKRKAT